jgi:hypothetical protein
MTPFFLAITLTDLSPFRRSVYFVECDPTTDGLRLAVAGCMLLDGWRKYITLAVSGAGTAVLLEK